MIHEVLSPNLGMGFAFSVLVMIKRQVLSSLFWLSRDSSVKRSFNFYADIFKGGEEGCWWQLAI